MRKFGIALFFVYLLFFSGCWSGSSSNTGNFLPPNPALSADRPGFEASGFSPQGNPAQQPITAVPDPQNLLMDKTPTGSLLDWEAVTHPDLQGYLIYRGTTPQRETMTLIAEVNNMTTQYIDENAPEVPILFYDVRSKHSNLPLDYDVLYQPNPCGPALHNSPVPVLLHNGALLYSATDLGIPGRGLSWNFSRSYNSRRSHVLSPLGYGWDFNYNIFLEILDAGQRIVLHNGNQRTDTWTKNGNNYIAPRGLYSTLKKNGTDWALLSRDGLTLTFASTGLLQRMEDSNGNALTFIHQGGKLFKVQDSLNDPETPNREITYFYENAGFPNLITKVRDFLNREIIFSYDANANLISVRSPIVSGLPSGPEFSMGKTEMYEYFADAMNPELNHNLKNITLPNEVAQGGTPVYAAQFTYYNDPMLFSFDHVQTQTTSGTNFSGSVVDGVLNYSWFFDLSSGYDAPESAARVIAFINNRKNFCSRYSINRRGLILKAERFDAENVTAHPVTPDGDFISTFEYNHPGEMSKATNPLGNFTDLAYDNLGFPLSMTRTPHIASDQTTISSSQSYVDIAYPAPNNTVKYRRLKTSTSPRGAITTYDYDLKGNLKKITDPAVGEGPGQSGFTLFWYNDKGQPIAKRNADKSLSWMLYYTQDSPNSGALEDLETGGGYLAQTLNLSIIPAADYVNESTPPELPAFPGNDLIGNDFVYDTVGNLLQHTDGRGVRSDYVVNELNQVMKVTRAADVLGMNGRFGGFNNSEEDSDDFTNLGYVTEFYYDFNNNLIASFMQNSDSNTIDGSPGKGGLGLAAGAVANIYPDGKTGYIESYAVYDLLGNSVRSSMEIGPGNSPATDTIVTSHTYDKNQNLITSTMPEGNIFSQTWNSRDLLATSTRGLGDADASTFTYQYDTNGNLLQFVNGRGHPSDYVYDGFDRVKEVMDAMGNQSFHHYDESSNTVNSQHHGPAGADTDAGTAGNTLLAQSHFQYDKLERCYHSAREILAAPFSGASAGLNPLKVNLPGGIDPTHLVSSFAKFDATHRVVESIEDDNNSYLNEYDGVGRLIKTNDPEGNKSFLGYDDNSNLVFSATFDQGQGGHLAMNAQEAQVFYSESRFDALNRPFLSFDNVGQTTHMKYDSRNNMTAVADANGPLNLMVGGFTYNFAGAGTVGTRVNIQLNSQGNVTNYFHDGLSRMVKSEAVMTINGEGNGGWTPTPDTTQVGGDGIIRMTQIWDKNSRLKSQTDDNGKTTTYRYDALNRSLATVYADGKFSVVGSMQNPAQPLTSAINTGYDEDDNALSYRDPNGSFFGSSYDALNRKFQCDILPAVSPFILAQSTTRQEWQWDGLSRLIFAKDNVNGTTGDAYDWLVFRGYDSLSHLTAETQTDGFTTPQTITYDWFHDSKLDTLNYPGGPALNYEYDALDRLKKQKQGGFDLATYDYLGGRLLQKNFENGTKLKYHNGTAPENGLVTGYDGARRIIQHKNSNGSGNISTYDYEYNRSNNRLSEIKTLPSLTYNSFFEYDSGQRLLSRTGTGTAQSWKLNGIPGLDGVGNWLAYNLGFGGGQQSAVPNDTNGYTNFSGMAQSNDPAGNLTDDGTNYYFYDALNRLRLVQRKSDSKNIAYYEYDVFGRRVFRDVDNSVMAVQAGRELGKRKKTPLSPSVMQNLAPSTVMESTTYFYSGTEVLEEYNDVADTLKRRYYEDNYLSGHFRMDGFVNEGQPSNIGSFYFHTNSQGWVEAITNNTGIVVERYNYTSYGEVTFQSSSGGDLSITESAYANPYLYGGYRYDPETGFYYCNARYYNPKQGRFISRDPLGTVDGMNLLEYCGSNPVNMVDPFGLAESDMDSEGSRWSNFWKGVGKDAWNILSLNTLRRQEEKVREVGSTGWAYNSFATPFEALANVGTFGGVDAFVEAKVVQGKSVAGSIGSGIAGTTTNVWNSLPFDNLYNIYDSYQQGNLTWEEALEQASAAGGETGAWFLAGLAAKGQLAKTTTESTILEVIPANKSGVLGGLEEPIFFGQQRASPTFSKKAQPSWMANKELTEVAEMLKSGLRNPEEIIIRVFRDPKTGLLVAENNRSLGALTLAGKKPISVVRIDPSKVDSELLKRLLENGGLNKVGDPMPAKTLPITENNILKYTIKKPD